MTPDMIWRCDITGNPVGTDTRMIGAPPCDCQGCRAADHIASLEAALAAMEKERDQWRKTASAAMFFGPSRRTSTPLDGEDR